MDQDKPTVFLSYNWGSDTIADEVEKRLSPIATVCGTRVQLSRDKVDCRDSICGTHCENGTSEMASPMRDER